MRLRAVLTTTTLAVLAASSLLVSCGNDDDSASEPAASETTVAVGTETTPAAGAAATSETTASVSDDADADEDESSEPYEVVPDADVAKGLPEMVRLAEETVSKIDAGAKDDAAASLDEAYEKWLAVEGTVKLRDQDAYLDIEDSLTLVTLGREAMDTAKARTGADEVRKLVDDYLAKFPGDGSEPPLPSVVAKKVDHKVDVQLSEYEITMPTPVPAGVIEFELENAGKEEHEFLVLRTDLAPEALPKDAEGNVDERGAGVTLVDEKEGIKPGEEAELVVELEPGKYVFLCNVVGHYALKMYLAAEVA